MRRRRWSPCSASRRSIRAPGSRWSRRWARCARVQAYDDLVDLVSDPWPAMRCGALRCARARRSGRLRERTVGPRSRSLTGPCGPRSSRRWRRSRGHEPRRASVRYYNDTDQRVIPALLRALVRAKARRRRSPARRAASQRRCDGPCDGGVAARRAEGGRGRAGAGGAHEAAQADAVYDARAAALEALVEHPRRRVRRSR